MGPTNQSQKKDKEIEKMIKGIVKSEKGIKSDLVQNYIQRASHGLQNYWIFWFDQNVTNEENKQSI